MARLQAQIKGCYVPADPTAISLLLNHLRPPSGPFSLLDPCAGEGKAIKQIAESLPTSKVYAIELSDVRAAELRANLPKAALAAPASFEGTAITSTSFGMVYVNPPFGSQVGGGNREEYNFLLRSTRLLVTKGVLAYVLPEYVLDADDDITDHLRANYRNLCRIPFPDDVRHYDEVFVLGVKRSSPATSANCEDWGEPGIYEIPESRNPSRFEKIELTDTEVLSILAKSPLRRSLLTPKDMDVVPRPPIPLGAGHTSLLVASGQLDGIVRPENEPPHVVRGTVRKSEYLARTEVKENEKSTSTTQIYSERITPIVRVATVDGEIITIGAQEESDVV